MNSMPAPELGYLYERIAAALRDEITAGQALKPGGRLPTQAELAATYGASRNVVRLALDLLESEGLIDRIQGGGAYVRRHQPLIRRPAMHYRRNPGAPFAEEAIASNRIPRYSHHTKPDRASPDVARRLNIGIGDDVMRTDYVSFADDQPVMLVTSYEPLAITRGTNIERPEEGPLMGAGVVDRFSSINQRPTVTIERIRVRMPRPSEVDELELKPGTPVVAATRVYRAGEVPLETADILLAGDVFEIEYEIPIQ